MFGIPSLRFWGAKAKSAVDATWEVVASIPTFGAGSTRQRITFEQIRSLYRGWVFACVNVRGRATGKIELRLFKTGAKGKDTELDSHPILDMLYSINENTTKRSAFSLISKHLDMYGKAFWYLDKEKNRILSRHPRYMAPIYDDEMIIIGWKYQCNVKGRQIDETYTLDEVIYFKEDDPTEDGKTQSLVEGAYEWIEAEVNATDWNRVFFRNNAVPPFLIETPVAMQPEAVKRLKQSFDEGYQGIANQHKMGVLPVGAKVHELSTGHKDMDFAVLDERFQDKICAVFQVPKIVLGISTDVNRATADAARYVFAMFAIEPQMQTIVDTLNEFFIPQFTNDPVYLTFDTPVPEDETQELEEKKAALAGQPYRSVNEIREEEGLEPVKGGDDVMTTFNMIPLGAPQPKETPAPAKGSAPAEVGRQRLASRHIANFLGSRERRKGLLDQASEKITAGISELFKGINFDEVAHKGFVQRVHPYVKLVAEKMRKITEKYEKDVLEHLQELVDDQKSMKDFVTEPDEVLAAVVRLLEPVMHDMTKKEGQVIFDNFKIDEPFEVSPKLAKTLKEKIELMAKSYDETTRALIEEAIKQGLENGDSIETIKETLKSDVFDYSNDVRAETIADTETFRLANIGIRNAYEETGVVQTVRWYTAADGDVCPFCEEMDGKTVGVADAFLSKGDTLSANGKTLEINYDDVLGGGLHPRCRCYVRADKIST